MTLRDRLAEAILTESRPVGAVMRVLTNGIEIVTPHREGCEGEWTRRLHPYNEPTHITVLRCSLSRRSYPPTPTHCPAEARIPEALLVELVEAKFSYASDPTESRE